MIAQGIYEHYKSTPDDRRYYQVLFLSRDEETHQILVNYQPLYWNNEGGIYDDGITIWTRTLENFTQSIEWNGKTVPRFTLVSSTI
jgi:hypothetical protein